MAKRNPKYSHLITQDEKGNIGTANSLHTAIKQIIGVPGANVVVGKRLVAFWCAFDKRVKIGFGADAGERFQMNEDESLYAMLYDMTT